MVSVFFAVMELFQSAVITAIRSYHLPAGKGRSAGVWSGVDGSAVGFAEFLWGVAGSLAEVVAEGGSVPEERAASVMVQEEEQRSWAAIWRRCFRRYCFGEVFSCSMKIR